MHAYRHSGSGHRLFSANGNQSFGNILQVSLGNARMHSRGQSDELLRDAMPMNAGLAPSAGAMLLDEKNPVWQSLCYLGDLPSVAKFVGPT
jgi:hypothetical protein